MKKIVLSAGIVFFFSLSALRAQSIDNKNWKAYLDAPINDTITFHIHSDSSFLTNSNGDIVIRLQCAIASDTVSMVNKDGEQHGCPDQKGKYKINIKDGDLILTLIDDPCEGRSRALHGVKWKAVK